MTESKRNQFKGKIRRKRRQLLEVKKFEKRKEEREKELWLGTELSTGGSFGLSSK